jgi:hypothetical protein
MTPSGIDPATFQFVAHCATATLKVNICINSVEFSGSELVWEEEEGIPFHLNMVMLEYLFFS